MKNQYVGDINDYVKYGILRCFAETGCCLGVWWMLTPSDGRQDGSKTAYLMQRDRYSHHDPALYSLLQRLVHGDRRDVSHIASSGLLGQASFFDELVPAGIASRRAWVERGLKQLAGADLVFFDPDNGLSVKSVSKGSSNAEKFLFDDEVSAAWSEGQSALVFQHYPREKRDSYIARQLERLQYLTPGGRVSALRGANVVYLLAVQDAHLVKSRRAMAMIAVRWMPLCEIGTENHLVTFAAGPGPISKSTISGAWSLRRLSVAASPATETSPTDPPSNGSQKT